MFDCCRLEHERSELGALLRLDPKTSQRVDSHHLHAYPGEPQFTRSAVYVVTSGDCDVQQGEAIANYSHLFRRSEGLYLTYSNRDTMEEDFLEQTQGRELQLFVVSDAEAILGIGDQGVGVRLFCSLFVYFIFLRTCLYWLIQGIGV